MTEFENNGQAPFPSQDGKNKMESFRLFAETPESADPDMTHCRVPLSAWLSETKTFCKRYFWRLFLLSLIASVLSLFVYSSQWSSRNANPLNSIVSPKSAVSPTRDVRDSGENDVDFFDNDVADPDGQNASVDSEGAAAPNGEKSAVPASSPALLKKLGNYSSVLKICSFFFQLMLLGWVIRTIRQDNPAWRNLRFASWSTFFKAFAALVVFFLLLMAAMVIEGITGIARHVRLQVMREGLALDETYALADEIDTKLDQNLNFAFSEQLGYLTQCPTNLGTGMRASVMLHLPALRKCAMIEKISSSLIKLGLTIRGIYGEGSEPKGDIYQISNQVTLGISEKTALKNLNDITLQIIAQERNCREKLAKNIQVSDSIGRAVGILKSAKLLPNEEFMTLISKVRLGLAMGLLTGISYDILNEITIKAQPCTLMKDAPEELSALQRDQKDRTYSSAGCGSPVLCR